MRTVNIADLKNQLSRHLKHVRQGEEILIRDRQVPVAKIVPLSSVNDFDAEELALAAAGLLRLPEKDPPRLVLVDPPEGATFPAPTRRRRSGRGP